MQQGQGSVPRDRRPHADRAPSPKQGGEGHDGRDGQRAALHSQRCAATAGAGSHRSGGHLVAAAACAALLGTHYGCECLLLY